MLEKQASQQSAKKQKRYTNFSDTDRAKIGQYAAEYENAAAQSQGEIPRSGIEYCGILFIVTTCVLVKTDGQAEICIAHLQR